MTSRRQCGNDPTVELTEKDRAAIARFREFLRLVSTDEGKRTIVGDPGWREYVGLPALPENDE